MNINELTIGESKELASMFGGGNPVEKQHAFVGMFVIARGYSCGVHAGEVVSVDGEKVMLKDSVRLWSWKAKEGIALSGVAQHGIKNDCKIDSQNPLIFLTGICELIPCSDKSRGTINGK